MNPFLWSGLEFLLFYLAFGVILLLIQYWWTKAPVEWVPIDLKKMADDPYRIAYMRGGTGEAIKIATISLVDRGLLLYDTRRLQIRDLKALESVQRPIEKEVLRQYFSLQKVYHAANIKLRTLCKVYHEELTKEGLLGQPDGKPKRWAIATLVIVFLLAASFIKIDIALSHGRYNILFLVVLTIFFVCSAIWLAQTRRVTPAYLLLRDLQTLFNRLKRTSHAIQPGGETDDFLLLAAIYGTQHLPHWKFPYVNQLYPGSIGYIGNSGGGGSDSNSGGSCSSCSSDSGDSSCSSSSDSGTSCGGCGGGSSSD